MMLDVLWLAGEVMIVGRDGQQRLWDLAERSYRWTSLAADREVARRWLERQLRARGVGTAAQFGFEFDGLPMGGSAHSPTWTGTASPCR